MSKVKKVVVSRVTGEEMEMAMSNFAIADAKIAVINAAMDEAIIKIRNKYQDDLAKWQKMKENSYDTLQTYSAENRDELFQDRQSFQTVNGTFGYRTGTPKLKLLKGFTWGSVTSLLREFLPDYIRVSEEPAKDKLLADRNKETVFPLLTKVGVNVEQDETFYVDAKKKLNGRVQ